MEVPQSEILTTNRLGKVFNNTVATYKYFWLISILQIHAKNKDLKISIWDIVIHMVANAWYPIHYFRLDFGKSDSLYVVVKSLQEQTGLSIESSSETIISVLNERLDNNIKSQLKVLTNNVPYRFLSPWINTSDDKEIVYRSQLLENNCLYSIHKDINDFYIVINKSWDTYLHKHYNILIDFAYWNLTLFLQKRNPNVPAIPNKLIRPETRNSLSVQHRYWDMVIEIGGPISCIYTGKELHVAEYDIDHFIPWSFVSHNLLWNLIPADGSINSSKSNKLPDLSIYLSKFAEIQKYSLSISLKAGKSSKLLEDYTSIGFSANDLMEMNNIQFFDVYKRIFNPIQQIALNMGYEIWKH